MKMLRFFSLGAFSALATITAMGQEPIRVEYFYDSDPGHGKGTIINGAQIGNNTLQLNTEKLACGSHLLCLRSQDSHGAWSLTQSRTVYIYKVPPTTATALEYFLDDDPGHGKGNQLNANEGENLLALDLTDAACGSHLLNLRALDNAGNWSTILSRTIYVYESRSFVELEYYFDTNDPGEGKGNKVDIPSEWDTAFSFDVDTEGLSTGNHYLCMRGKAKNGIWSEISREPFAISESSGIAEIKMTLPISMKANRQTLTITDVDNSHRGDCQVEVFDASGTRIAMATWKSGTSQLSVPINSNGVLIVKVADTSNGLQVVRRIVCQ